MDRRSAVKKTGLWAGATVALPGMLSLLQACKEETRPAWQPEFFTEEEADTIAVLIDTILPSTETPGALDVKVDLFLDKLIARTYDPTGQQKMRDDIAAFNQKCKERFGAVFAGLEASQRAAVLQSEESTSGTFNPGVWGTTIGDQEPVGFYRQMKAMAIWAYFTSEEIGEKVLAYDPIPGTYEGCIPLSEVGNRWSL